jgi:fibronectin type 3 domain-containing protein
VSIFRNASTGDSIVSGSFLAKVDYATGVGPYYVVLADLNGDGKTDLVVSNSTDNTLSVFQNTSISGSLTEDSFAPKTNFPVSNFPYYLATCDVDGDGKPEVVVTNQNSNTISVFRNTVGTPATPVLFIATPGDGQVILKWSKSPEVDFLRYRIYCDTLPHPISCVDSVDGIVDTLRVITGLTNGKAYYFRVTAVDSGELVSLYSNELSATPSLVPVITAIVPVSARVGSTVTITGFNFSPIGSNNIVWFGGVKATITSASDTSLIVSVPSGAMYASISVTVAGLTAYSTSKFDVTFPGGNISSGRFAPKVDFPSASGTHGLAIADLDGDGKLDIMATNPDSNTISIFRNIGAVGTIDSNSFALKVDFATGNCPFDMAIGDLDGDGKLDLAVINYNSNTVTILRNASSPGSISFETGVDFATGSLPFDVAIGDVNGDGKPDIAITNYHSDLVSVYQNNCSIGSIATGSFTRTDFTTGSYPNGIAIGDVDGDGRADLVVTNVGNSTISVFRNTCTGTSITIDAFAPKVDFAAGNYPIFSALGDLDEDGKLDIVTNNYYANSATVLHNVSDPGSITSSSFERFDYTAGNGPFHIKIGDLDGDGKPDLALLNNPINEITILRNIASPGSMTFSSFTAKAELMTGNSPSRVVIGDLDGDGKSDLVVTNGNDRAVSVLRNMTDVPAPPENVTAVAGNSRVVLKWNKNIEPDFLRYLVYCDTVPHPTTKVDSIGAAADTSCVITGLTNGKLYYFRITAVDSSGLESDFSNEVSATPSTVGVQDDQGLNLPKRYELYQNFPNPFNPSTTIRFDLPARSEVRLAIYDILGREIATLLQGTVTAGYQSIEWKANVATGLYFYRIEAVSTDDPAKRFVSVRKMLILR